MDSCQQKKSTETLYCLYIMWCLILFLFCSLQRLRENVFNEINLRKMRYGQTTQRLVKQCHPKEIVRFHCMRTVDCGRVGGERVARSSLSLVCVSVSLWLYCMSSLKLQYSVFNLALNRTIRPTREDDFYHTPSMWQRGEKKKNETKKRKRPWKIYFYLLPVLVLFSVMCVGPFYLVLFSMKLYGEGLVHYYNTVEDVYTK